jgi:hypothetical protein
MSHATAVGKQPSLPLAQPDGDVAQGLEGVLSNPTRLASLRQAASARMQTWSPSQNIATTIEALQATVSNTKRPA